MEGANASLYLYISIFMVTPVTLVTSGPRANLDNFDWPELPKTQGKSLFCDQNLKTDFTQKDQNRRGPVKNDEKLALWL